MRKNTGIEGKVGLQIYNSCAKNRQSSRCNGERLSSTRPTLSFNMLTEDASHFLNRLRMPLRRMWGANHNLGCHTVNMRALIGDHSVGLAGDWPIAKHRDDRMRGYIGIG